MNRDAKIYVAGHQGLVGSALVRQLRAQGYANLLLLTHHELDLTKQSEVEKFFAQERPEYVFLAAAKVGGILANSTYPAAFIYQNLLIQTNVIHEAYRTGVKRLLFLGSSCIYPKHAPQPMKEECLLTGPLEPTNRAYAVAKIAGIEMCWSHNRQHGTRFLAAMPSNLYGPGDHYDLHDSHVLPALIRKMHEAKVSGEDATIRELAELIADVVGFSGELVFDASKPDGTPQKLLDISLVTQLGWTPRTSLREGLAETYAEFVQRAYAIASTPEKANVV